MLPSEYTKWLRHKTNSNLLASDRELGLNVSRRHSNISKIPLPWTPGMVGLFSKNFTSFILRVFAGTGVAGISGENGQALNAQMDRPRGLAFDRTKENLYIGVSPGNGGGRILKVNLNTGIITRVAGDPSKELALTGTGLITNVVATTTSVTYTLHADTPSRAKTPAEDNPPAQIKHSFEEGQSVRITDIPDPNQNLNITGNITSITDTTITLARSGAAVSSVAVRGSVGTLAVNAGIVNPYNVVFDSSGNMYFANQYYWNSCVLKVDTDGYISRYAGSGQQAQAAGNGVHRLDTSVRIGSPRGIAIDSSNNIYVAETDTATVRMIKASDNIISVIVGAFNVQATIAADNYPTNDASGTSVRLRQPTALAVDSTSSNLYISMASNGITQYNGIYRYNIASGKIYVILQSLPGYNGDGIPAINARLVDGGGRGIDIDNLGNIYLLEQSTAIRKIDSNGIITTYTDNRNYDIVWHLAVRSATEIYVCNSRNQVVVYRSL